MEANRHQCLEVSAAGNVLYLSDGIRSFVKLQNISYDHSRAHLVTSGFFLLAACILAALLWGDQVRLIMYAYPGLAVLVGGWLYGAQPALYLGFSWWIWFITPFVRRVVDYQVGYFNPVNPIMLAPFGVTGWAVLTLLRFGDRLKDQAYFPFLLSLLGVLYGYLVGVVKAGAFSATFALLEWLCPILIGFHACVFWQLYPAHRRVIRSVFAGGVFLMGIYGIAQYLNPFPWDTQWLIDSGMTSSHGFPAPTSFNIFSTLNSRGPFAFVMFAGLLILFDGRRLLSRLAIAPGVISLLLSMVRSSWGGLGLGMMFLSVRFKGSQRTRLIGILTVGSLLLIPMWMYTPNTSRITSRADTMTHLAEDNSLNARLRLYTQALPNALRTPIGRGIGGFGVASKLQDEDRAVKGLDSGIINILLSLGWVGSLLYLGGFVELLRRIVLLDTKKTDPFGVIATAIVVSLAALLVITTTVKGLLGALTWCFLGLALASSAYHE